MKKSCLFCFVLPMPLVDMGMDCQMDLGFAYKEQALQADNSSEYWFAPGAREEERIIAQAPLMDLMQAVLGLGACMKIRARGFSMDPYIRDGDDLTLSPLTRGGPRLGDIVAFKFDQCQRLSIHRIIRVRENSFQVKGDCCFEPDDFVPLENILGVVKRIDRAGCKIRIGLGPGKKLIAFLSRMNWLWPFISLISKTISGRFRLNGGVSTR